MTKAPMKCDWLNCKEKAVKNLAGVINLCGKHFNEARKNFFEAFLLAKQRQ